MRASWLGGLSGFSSSSRRTDLRAELMFRLAFPRAMVNLGKGSLSSTESDRRNLLRVT